jgi:hypothetical protein
MSSKEQMEYDLKYGTLTVIRVRGKFKMATLIDTRPLHEPAPPMEDAAVFNVPVANWDYGSLLVLPPKMEGKS